MFGIGGTELALILLFGFLIFGPDKLPQIARTVGKAIRQFKGAQEKMNDVIKSEVYDPLNDLSKDLNPFSSLSSDASNKTAASDSSGIDAATLKSGEATASTSNGSAPEDAPSVAKEGSTQGMTFADAAKAAAATKAVGPAKKSTDAAQVEASLPVNSPAPAVRQETFVQRKAAAEEKKASRASTIYDTSASTDVSKAESSNLDTIKRKEGEE